MTLSPISAKICLIVGNTLVARRAGQCSFMATQAGDPNTFAAPLQVYNTTVVPAGAPPPPSAVRNIACIFGRCRSSMDRSCPLSRQAILNFFK